MGVNNTRYDRVTIYLKPRQIDYLDAIMKKFSETDGFNPSRSDILRAILDEFCNTEDWQTQGLLKQLSIFSKEITTEDLQVKRQRKNKGK